MTTKIKFQTKALMTALDAVTKIAQKKSTISITEHLLFNVKKTACLITANNLEIIANAICACESTDEMQFLLHHSAVDSIKLLPTDTIDFEITLPNITIIGGFDTLTYSAVNHDEFPKPNPNYKKNLTGIPLTKDIMESIEKAGDFIASKEAASLRPVFTCVALIMKGNKMTIYGTDAHAMYRNIFTLPQALPEGTANQILIPESLLRLTDGLPKDANLSIQFSNDAIAVKSKTIGVEYFAKPLVDKIPDYDRIANQKGEIMVHFDHAEFKRSVELALSMGRDISNALVMNFNDEISVNREMSETQKTARALIKGTYMTDKKPLRIGLNPFLLKKGITSIKSPKISLEGTSPSMAVILRPILADAKNEEMILVMPLKINEQGKAS